MLLNVNYPSKIFIYNNNMKILFITDLYPVKENEKTTPRTLFDFVQEWKAAGNEVDEK